MSLENENAVSRRGLLKSGLVVSGAGIPLLGIGHWSPVNAAENRREQASDKRRDDNPDRDAVLAAGMTEAEAECWKLAAETAGAFFALPELHPSDAHEVASAIHIIQHKLLARPTYRKYLETLKAGGKRNE